MDRTKSEKSQQAAQDAKHIALWGGWYGSNNVGDQVLLLTITEIIARHFEQCGLGPVRFTVFTAKPEIVDSYAGRYSSCKIRALQNKRQLLQVVRSLAECDLFIFGGGVPFYEELSHLLVMVFLVGVARLFRTPYMTWAVSSQEVESKLALKIFKWVLDGAAAITYRDEHTRKLFEACNVQKPMYMAADSGFQLQVEEDGQAAVKLGEVLQRAGWQEGTRPLVALTPRLLGGREIRAQQHYRVRTQEQSEKEVLSFAAALDWLWEHEYQPIFVPMNTVFPDDDRLAAQRVIEAARHGSQALLINEGIPPRLAPAIYRYCQASYVARVHGSITSAIGKCPVMMYAFDPKHMGIMEVMGLAQYSLAEREATPERTVQILSTLLANRPQVRQLLAKRLEQLMQDALIPVYLAEQVLVLDGRSSSTATGAG